MYEFASTNNPDLPHSFSKNKEFKMSLHRSQLFQQKIRYIFDLIICQLIDLDCTVTKILFLPCYHLAFEVYMFLFLTYLIYSLVLLFEYQRHCKLELFVFL